MNGFMIVNYGNNRKPGYESAETLADAREIFEDSYELLQEAGDVVELIQIVDGEFKVLDTMFR